MTRHPHWRARLATLLAAAESRPFDGATWNCGRFVLAAVEAVIGRRPAWRPGPCLASIADTAGFRRIPHLLAAPGDVVLAPDPDRLGVLLDHGRVAFVGPQGLLRQPITTCTTAWRIG